MFAAIEAGGTKFVCAVGDKHTLLYKTTVQTRDVGETRADVLAFIEAAIHRFGPLDAVGIGSFGPLQLDRRRVGYGSITTTPKAGWSGTDIPEWFSGRYGVPVVIDTDVNAAALAEAKAADVRRLAYVTVGTGIGVGLVIDGRSQAGFGHPEAGHVPVRRHPAHAGYAGCCSFHGDCLEGLASGPAISEAWGCSLAELPADHPAWEVEAEYLCQLCATLILTVAPERIVLGGGVMQQARLLPMVRKAAIRVLAGYSAQWEEMTAVMRVTPPLQREPSGLVGAFMLAETVHSAPPRPGPGRGGLAPLKWRGTRSV